MSLPAASTLVEYFRPRLRQTRVEPFTRLITESSLVVLPETVINAQAYNTAMLNVNIKSFTVQGSREAKP